MRFYVNKNWNLIVTEPELVKALVFDEKFDDETEAYFALSTWREVAGWHAIEVSYEINKRFEETS